MKNETVNNLANNSTTDNTIPNPRPCMRCPWRKSQSDTPNHKKDTSTGKTEEDSISGGSGFFTDYGDHDELDDINKEFHDIVADINQIAASLKELETRLENCGNPKPGRGE